MVRECGVLCFPALVACELLRALSELHVGFCKEARCYKAEADVAKSGTASSNGELASRWC